MASQPIIILASIVGEVVEYEKGIHYNENGKMHPPFHPKVDPFWAVFGKAASKNK